MNYISNTLQNNYFKFTGRARRREFWYFYIFYIIIALPLEIVGLVTNTPLLPLICHAVLLLPWLGVGVRRMHDVGKSGFYIFIPFYGLFLLFKDGEKGDNKYGPNPKEIILPDPYDFSSYPTSSSPMKNG